MDPRRLRCAGDLRRDRGARRDRRRGPCRPSGSPTGLGVRARRARHPVRRRRGRRRRRAGSPPPRGHPRRPRVDHLHLRHDRPAQGLRALAPLLRGRGPRAAGAARRLLQRADLDAALPADRARVRPGDRDRGDRHGMHARAHRRRQAPARRPRRLPAHLRAGGAPGVREGLQQREAEGPQRRQGQDLRPRRVGRHRVLEGARRQAGPAAPEAACTDCSTSSSTASCALRSAAGAWRRCPAVRRSAPGSGTSSAASG